MSDAGRVIHWMALPVPLAEMSSSSRKAGTVYTCSRRAFVLWLHELAVELESYDCEHARQLGRRAAGEVDGV